MGWIESKIEDIAATVVTEGEKTRAEIAANHAEARRGQRIDGALAVQFRANHLNYHVGGKRLVGWSVRATGGPVVITFHDGRNADGDPLGAVCLDDGRSETVALTPGVGFVDGLFAEVTGAGTVIGALWIGAVD